MEIAILIILGIAASVVNMCGDTMFYKILQREE